jgi:hypothetical protein
MPAPWALTTIRCFRTLSGLKIEAWSAAMLVHVGVVTALKKLRQHCFATFAFSICA